MSDDTTDTDTYTTRWRVPDSDTDTDDAPYEPEYDERPVSCEWL
jgi:hypothetical protein